LEFHYRPTNERRGPTTHPHSSDLSLNWMHGWIIRQWAPGWKHLPLSIAILTQRRKTFLALIFNLPAVNLPYSFVLFLLLFGSPYHFLSYHCIFCLSMVSLSLHVIPFVSFLEPFCGWSRTFQCGFFITNWCWTSEEMQTYCLNAVYLSLPKKLYNDVTNTAVYNVKHGPGESMLVQWCTPCLDGTSTYGITSEHRTQIWKRYSENQWCELLYQELTNWYYSFNTF